MTGSRDWTDMDNNKLTKRQQQVLDYITEQTEKNGYPPTVREIGEAIGLSSSATVHAHLNMLESKGYLHRDASKSRTLTVIGRDDPTSTTPSEHGIDPASTSRTAMASMQQNIVNLPLVGRVAAGTPILAEQNVEATLPLPKDIVGDAGSFLLKVRGSSMIGIGINDGDYVVVKEQASADNGDIVVAMLDDGATVKRFFKEKDCIRLQPENDSMEPIYTQDAAILGKVVALFRRL